MPEEVALRVGGQRWRAWSDIQITLGLDSCRTVTFTSPYEHERELFRSTFQPFTYKDVDVYVAEQLLFTGTLVDVAPDVAEDARSVKCSAYSKPAVLGDVTPPASAWPLELNGLKLREIGARLAAPFGIDVELDGSEGAPFSRTAIEPDELIFAFLTKLATERGLVVADTPEGALRFLRSPAPGRPSASFREGVAPLRGVSSTFDPQSYYSEVTAIAKAGHGRAGSKYTVQNPFLRAPLRPLTFTLSDTDPADAPTAARAKLGRMLGNALQVKLDLPTWRNPGGAIWEPGATVLLEASSAMVVRETAFMIREVTLRQDATAESATLEVMLPGAFSGEVPEVLPWA